MAGLGLVALALGVCGLVAVAAGLFLLLGRSQAKVCALRYAVLVQCARVFKHSSPVMSWCRRRRWRTSQPA